MIPGSNNGGFAQTFSALKLTSQPAQPPTDTTPTLYADANGAVVLRDSAGALWALAPGADGAGVQTLAAAGAVLATTQVLYADTTTAAFAATLPTSPVASRMVLVVDKARQFGTHNLTLAGNGKTINGASTLVLSTQDEGALLIYNGAAWNALPIASGGGGSPFDPASPGPIGGATPGAGTFTTLIGTLGTGWAIGATGRPTTDITYNLGTTAYRFAEAHVKKIIAGPDTDGNGYLTIESGSDARGIVVNTTRGLGASGAMLMAMYENSALRFVVGPTGAIGSDPNKLHALPDGTGALMAEVGRGQATLVAGTVTVTMTGIQNTSKVFPSLVTPGGTMGARIKVTVTGGSGFTLTAVDASGATVATDTSTLDYLVAY